MTLSFQFKKSSTTGPHEPHVIFDLPRRIEVTSESIQISLASVGEENIVIIYLWITKKSFSVAGVGGYVGMILGVSLMDFEKVLNIALHIMTSQFKK